MAGGLTIGPRLPLSSERSTFMKRRVVILVIAIAVLGVCIWQMPNRGDDGRVTMEEIQAKIAREKAELKAAVRARAVPQRVGLCPAGISLLPNRL